MGKLRAKSFEFWYRRKYSLTSNDPRFLGVTIEEIETEYWAYQYEENKGGDEVEDEDFDLDAELKKIEDQDDWETIIES